MPFAGYADFDECVRKNGDKSDPKAYCGKIQHAVEAVEEDMSKAPLQTFSGREEQFEVQAFEDTEENGMRARIRIIKAGLSKNNRNYRISALKKAAKEGVFNDLKMFVGHSKDLPLKRDMSAFVSYTDGVEYVDATESLEGYANFVDRPFFEKARAAKKHIGVSIDSLLRGTRHPQPGGRALEDISEFAQPRSVDWVMFPSAGGEILAFESEEGEVDWAAVEAEAANLSEADIQKNLPTLWAKWHPKTDNQPGVHGNAQESEGEKELIGKEEIEEIVTARLTAYQEEQKQIEAKRATAAEQVRAAFATSGLPEKTRARVMQGFEGVEQYDEAAVKKSITDAQEELKALGVGPKITGMGPGSTTGGEEGTRTLHAHESVMSAFGARPVTKTDGKKDSDDQEDGK